MPAPRFDAGAQYVELTTREPASKSDARTSSTAVAVNRTAREFGQTATVPAARCRTEVAPRRLLRREGVRRALGGQVGRPRCATIEVERDDPEVLDAELLGEFRASGDSREYRGVGPGPSQLGWCGIEGEHHAGQTEPLG